MDIVQSFYDRLAPAYDKLFQNWQATTGQQAAMLDSLFRENGFGREARVLDCACGIGTQAIGLAQLGYSVTASDISSGALRQAKERAEKAGVSLCLKKADFCALSQSFGEMFSIVLAMDNALPHMLTREALAQAVKSIAGQLEKGGLFVASIRDYDALLEEKPPYSPPYIHKTEDGQRVAFQTWSWEGDCYQLVQYIIEDGKTLNADKFTCRYRATRRAELTQLLWDAGFREVRWLQPEETGFYQPIVVAKK